MSDELCVTSMQQARRLRYIMRRLDSLRYIMRRLDSLRYIFDKPSNESLSAG
jgi:hypothetical protein